MRGGHPVSEDALGCQLRLAIRRRRLRRGVFGPRFGGSAVDGNSRQKAHVQNANLVEHAAQRARAAFVDVVVRLSGQTGVVVGGGEMQDGVTTAGRAKQGSAVADVADHYCSSSGIPLRGCEVEQRQRGAFARQARAEVTSDKAAAAGDQDPHERIGSAGSGPRYKSVCARVGTADGGAQRANRPGLVT